MRIKSFSLGGSTNFSAERPLLLIHVFKTAGSSLRLRLERSVDFRTIQGVYAANDFRSRLKRYVPEEDLSNTGATLYYGHMFHGVHKQLDVPPTYGVFLRSAVDRALSQYAHAERFSSLPKRSLSDYLEARELQLDNLMTRMISGHREVPFGEIRQPHLDIAKRNLESYCFVGFFEQMQQSIDALEKVVGVTFVQAQQMNVNRHRQPMREDAALDCLESLNWADKELYEFATEIHRFD